MTFPVTPDPGIHSHPQQSSPLTSNPLFGGGQFNNFIERLILSMIWQLVAAIIDALGGHAPTTPPSTLPQLFSELTTALESIPLIGPLVAALTGIENGNLSDLESWAEKLPLIGPLVQALAGIQNGNLTDLENWASQIPLIGQIVQAITGQGSSSNPLGAIESDVQSGLQQITSWFGDLTGILGNPTLGGSTPAAAGQPVAASGQSLTSLLNLVGTNTVITPAQLAAISPGSGTNVLPTSSSWSMLQGNSLWAYDGPGRTGGGCIRTVRTGVVTVFYCHGLDDLAPPIITGPGPTDPMLTTFQIANAYGLDFTHFEFVNIPHQGIGIPMGPDHTEALNNFISAIQNIPGKFCIYAGSEGAWIASDIYDLLRYGQYYDHVAGKYVVNTTLRARNDDFLLGVVWGNMRRQPGTTFPGAPIFGATGYGCLDPALANVEEDRWWEFTVDAGTYPAYGSMTGITFEFSDSIGDCPPPSDPNGGQIRAIVSQAVQETSLGLGDIISVGGDLLEAFISPTSGAAQVWWNLSTPQSAHAVAWTTVQPFLASGDARTYAQIIFDAINNLAPHATPPEGGVRHQIEGVRQPVQPFQVVKAACYAEWINVFVPVGYTTIIMGINAYDKNGVYIPGPPGQPVSVIAESAIVNAPVSQSNWQLLKADFVTPPNTASACIVFDVEPLAMTTGTVWFDIDNAVFEVTNLLDGALIDSATIQGLLPQQIGGVQGEADLLTSIQNMLDGLASANSGTVVTGSTIAAMFSTAAQTANSAAQALSLSVGSANTIGNLANPIYTGFRQGSQVTTQFVSSTTSVAAGASIMGILNISPALTVGLVEFLASGSSLSNVYVNIYSLDSSSGALTNLWSSTDISSSITGSLGWVEVSLGTSTIPASINEFLAIEIANNGSGALSVAAASTGIPNHPSIIPVNQGASRTLSGTGGVSPTSIASGVVTYSGTIPCIAVCYSAGAPAIQPQSAQSWTTAGTYPFQLPSWIADGDQVVIAMVSGGGGGNSGQFFGYGYGGLAGSWATETLTYGVEIPGSTTQLTVTVGAGGVSGGGQGGASSVSGAGVTTLTTGPGGLGASSGSTVGSSPGSISYAGRPYFGGIASGGAANPPGGGGGAGNAGFFGLGGTPAYAGADGEVWINVVQGIAQSSETLSYSAPGTYTYNIPSWANHLDFILLGGGGSGATYDKPDALPGGAGNPGMWNAYTIDKSGFPSGAITVTVGSGGAQAVPGPKITWSATNTNCATNSITLPAHNPGDLLSLLAVGFGGSPNPVAPPAAGGTVPAWKQLGGGVIGGMSVYVAWVIATANNHTAGVWANTHMMQASTVHGVDPVKPLGAGTGTGGLQYPPATPPITLVDNSGNSSCPNIYIVNNGGAQGYAVAETWDPAPTGYTRQGYDQTAYGAIVLNLKNDTTTAGGAFETYSPASNLNWIGLNGEFLMDYQPPFTAKNGNSGSASSVSGTGMTTVTAAGGTGGSLDGVSAQLNPGGKTYNGILYTGTLPSSGIGGVGGTSAAAYTGGAGGNGEVWIVARS